MMRLLIERLAWLRFGTLGQFHLIGDHGTEHLAGYTIELPWRDNEVGRSCIPLGVYTAERHASPKFGATYWLRNVPGRSEILIHTANSKSDLDGCIGPGRDYGWWQQRSELAVWHSGDAMADLLERGAGDIQVDIRPWQPHTE
jgi:hypothetical protein